MAHLEELNARLLSSCQNLWQREALVDCTIACAQGRLKAHKLILSASSDFLSNLLEENPGEHPTLILNTSLESLTHLLNYLYYGTLPSQECVDFFILADKLQLHGSDGWSAVATIPATLHTVAPQPCAPAAPTPRRRGRPRKSRQTVRSDDASVQAAGDPTSLPLTSPDPTTSADTSDLLGQAVTGSVLPPPAPAPHQSAALAHHLAAAGIPEQLFGPIGDATDGMAPPADPALAAAQQVPQSAADQHQPHWSPVKQESPPAEWHVDTAEPPSEWRPAEEAPAKSPQPARQVEFDVVMEGSGRRSARRTSSSIQCSFCGKMCCNKQTLKVHARIHTDERPYACPAADCGKAFRQRVHLRTHVRCHDSNRHLSCTQCSHTFKFESNLRRHQALHETGQPFHPRRQRDEKLILCNLCGKKFVSPAAFENHVRVHTNQRPFICDVCQKGFKQKSHLTEHKRIHSGQKPFKCSRCQLTFYNRTRFKLHQVQHINEALLNGEKSELLDSDSKFPSCTVCKKRFINASNLRLHERRHSDDKPHRCHQCSCRFKLAKTLVKHLASHADRQRQDEERREQEQRKSEESAAAAGIPVLGVETPGQAVIILREEEDGSLTYVPGLQDPSPDGRVVQVVLNDSERKRVEQLMTADGLNAKWLETPVRELIVGDSSGAGLQEQQPEPASTQQTLLMQETGSDVE